MSIKDNVSINVLNYNEFVVISTSQLQSYTFSPAKDGVPSRQYMSFSEIQYINGQSDAFRSGLLMFDDKDKEELYAALNIHDWRSIITNSFIEDAIVNPNVEKLQRLINITNASVFDRVKTIFVRLINENTDISNRVINIINARQTELSRRQYKSEIILKPFNEKRSLDESNLELIKEIESMKEMIDQLKIQNSLLSEKNEQLSDMLLNNQNTEYEDNKEVDDTSVNKQVEDISGSKKRHRAKTVGGK